MDVHLSFFLLFLNMSISSQESVRFRRNKTSGDGYQWLDGLSPVVLMSVTNGLKNNNPKKNTKINEIFQSMIRTTVPMQTK